MAEVEIYTTPFCPYGWRARSLLGKKGVTFAEIDLREHPERRAEMTLRARGRTTVPQILVDGRAIGGWDELAALESRGELDALLAAGDDGQRVAGSCGRGARALAVDET